MNFRFQLPLLLLTMLVNRAAGEGNAPPIPTALDVPLPAFYSGQTAAPRLVDLPTHAQEATRRQTQGARPKIATVQFTPPSAAPSSPSEIYDGLPKNPTDLPRRSRLAARPAEQADRGDDSAKQQVRYPDDDAEEDDGEDEDDAEEDSDEDEDEEGDERQGKQRGVEALADGLQTLDRLLNSPVLQRVLKLTAENLELQAELRVMRAETRMQLELMEIKLQQAKERAELLQLRLSELQRQEAFRRPPASGGFGPMPPREAGREPGGEPGAAREPAGERGREPGRSEPSREPSPDRERELDRQREVDIERQREREIERQRELERQRAPGRQPGREPGREAAREGDV